jgi:hypothetical protein
VTRKRKTPSEPSAPITDDGAFLLWQRFFEFLHFDCATLHERGLLTPPYRPPEDKRRLPCTLTPQDYRALVVFLHSREFTILCQVLLRRSPTIIRALLAKPFEPIRPAKPQARTEDAPEAGTSAEPHDADGHGAPGCPSE